MVRLVPIQIDGFDQDPYFHPPREDLPFVQNTLESADTFRNEVIVVVGAGDSAIKDAVALARHNRVVIVNRRKDFVRAKEGNIVQIQRILKTVK